MTFNTEKNRIIAEKDAEIINLRKTCSELWNRIEELKREERRLKAENERLVRKIEELDLESHETFRYVMNVYDEDHDESQ